MLGKSVVGPSGEDTLVTSIRNNIEAADSFYAAFFNILLYLVLLVFTISFTVQYLKRVVYVAFLILISPLIAITYPIDKIKDNKSQAFDFWLKEFIFNVLLQVVHLLLYYLLISCASELVDINKVYALVAIGALLPAEKFFRKLFGIDSKTSMGNMASAFGGAAIMNSINKMGTKGSSGGKSGGKEEKPKIRTANPGGPDPYDAFRKDSGEDQPSPGTPPKTPDIPNPNSQSDGKQNPQPETPKETKPSTQTKSKPKANSGAPKRNIKNKPAWVSGMGNVAKRYVLNKKTAKGALRLLAKGAGAVTLGTIGLAAGIATGELENAFAGALGGLTAGSRVGGNLVDGGANLLEGVAGGIKGIRDTYKEGKYGKDEYAKMKFDEEFKKSQEYNKLIDKYPGKENDIQEFLNSGITDTKLMKKAIEKNYKTGEAIAYIKMAQAKDCPDAVLYDNEKFKVYLAARGIPETDANKIRKGIITFK